MKIINNILNIDIELKKGESKFIIIEKKSSYVNFIEEMINQLESDSGNFIFSLDDKIIKCSSTVEMIIDPFLLDINNKRIINKLYAEIKQDIVEYFLSEYKNIEVQLNEFADKICCVSHYNLSHSYQYDVNSVLKLLDLKLDYSSESLFEKMIGYIGIMSSLCNIKLFVLIGINQYLSCDDLERLFEYAKGKEVNIIFVENQMICCANLTKFRKLIIDIDDCIISSYNEDIQTTASYQDDKFCDDLIL